MSSNSHQSDSSQGGEANNSFSSHDLDSTQLIARLLYLQQRPSRQSHGVLETFCHEVTLASHGLAQLILLGKRTRILRSWYGFPVETNGRFYGQLFFAPDPAQPAQPAVPLDTAQVVAGFCALSLHNLEVITFYRGNAPLPVAATPPTFTPREKEVLELVCRGHDLQAIGKILHITLTTANQYRRQIYAKLGVQNEREAAFVAFSSGQFFPIKGLAPHVFS